jgi:multidrug transporter EmrE-like cation transporter
MRLALATDWNYLALGDVTLPDSITLALAVGALLIVGLSALVKIMRRVPLALLPEVTLVLLVVSPLFFLRHTTPVFVHYQLVALPALALIAGASAKLFRQRFWPPLMVVLMLIIAAVWSAQIGYSLDIAARQITPNGLGTPLGITRAVAASVPDDLPVLFFTHGDDTTVHGEAAVFDALWWGRDHRIINGEALLILPPYPAYLLATLAPFQAWEEIEAAGLARAVHEFPRREGEGPGFVATTFDGEALPQGFIAVEPVLLEHGVQLEGWKARMVGPRLRISTLWRVSALPPSGTYQQFHHLRTADTLEDQPLHVADVPISAHTWQMGDWLVVMADFFVDSSREYWVDVGHYMLSDMTRMTHADGDSVRLGPFTLP